MPILKLSNGKYFNTDGVNPKMIRIERKKVISNTVSDIPDEIKVGITLEFVPIPHHMDPNKLNISPLEMVFAGPDAEILATFYESQSDWDEFLQWKEHKCKFCGCIELGSDEIK